MFLLEIFGGWFLLSCVTAPFIGRFIATNATITDHDYAGAETQLQPARSYGT